MNLLLIHQSFVDRDHAGGTRHVEMARYLVEQGHAVSVVAGNLNYLTGKPFVDSKQLFVRQRFDGVEVLRSYVYPAIHRSFGWRVVAFLSFMVSSVYAALRAGKVDVVMGTSPPIFQLFSAWLVSVVKWRPLVVEIRDLWPEFAIDMGVLKNPIIIWMARLWESFIYKRATHLVVNSPAYRGYLISKGVAEEKITVIPNGVDPSMFDVTRDADVEGLRKSLGVCDKFVVVYAGAVGLANDIDTLVAAAERLRSDTDDAASNSTQSAVHILILGDGKEKRRLQKVANDKSLLNVTFLQPIPKNEMASILAASDACVATLQPIPMFKTTYPNKVFDYMAARRPTILAIDGVIREVIESSEGGVYVKPGDPKRLADGIREMRDLSSDERRAMGERARAYVEKHFDRDKQTKKLEQVLRSLVS